MTQEQLRMQMLAGIITEGQYKEKLNENLQVGNTVNIGDTEMGPADILLVTDYGSYSDEIDREIQKTGWEANTPKEELTWYKVKFGNGDIGWYDNEELNAYN
jgi:hypothetical protein